MSASTENFLKSIYLIHIENLGDATGSKLATKLNITNAAITDMTKKLARDGMVKYRKYQRLELTPEGKTEALKIIRKHRLWELFLTKVLNYSWDEVHEDAEMLEHQTSDLLLDRLDEFLGYPKYDPHGKPIPDRKGNIPDTGDYLRLTECTAGVNYKIARIHPGTNDLTVFFRENNFRIGRTLTVERKYKESVEVILDRNKIVIPETIADNIYVVNRT